MQRLRQILFPTFCLVLLIGLGHIAKAGAFDIESGKKGKVKGSIESRSGDVVTVREKKDAAVVVVRLTDATKIERTKDFKFRHQDMDVTALVPGLTIEAEGVGNGQGQLDASTIKFDPDEFAIEVAEEQQINANAAATRTNAAAAKKAQSTANAGVAEANAAQASANGAQASANQAQTSADAAGAIGLMDAAAIVKVNGRVSDLDDYKKVAMAGIYFPANGATLDDPAKADLTQLASVVGSLDGYLIEIAGYASSTGSKQWDQKLGAERAAAVATYLRDQQNIPMRRILTPASYGATHPDAPNSDPQGRALNRRVDVTVLVNKGLSQ